MRVLYAAPIPGSIHKAVEERFRCRLATCYAQTEVCRITGGAWDEDFKLNSAGRVHSELVDVRIVDNDEREVPPDTVGEITVRPKAAHTIFEGYWRNPQVTLELMKGLWYHTGDLGRVDEDGYLFYEGRKKDALRRRGENISAVELENAVREHASILEVAAIGVPSDVLEDDIFIVVETVPGAPEIDFEELHAFCKSALPNFMVPRYIEVVEAIPRNENNKIEKFKLREQGTGPRTWDTTTGSFLGGS